MVVAEDPALRNTLTSLLEKWDFQAFPAADSIDALRQIYHVLPQIVVTDLELSKSAGFELLPFLRRRFPEMGVVVLSRGKVRADDNSHQAIADDIAVIDPLDPELLRNSLRGMSAKVPFRRECEAEGSSTSASSRHASSPKLGLAPLTKAAWRMS